MKNQMREGEAVFRALWNYWPQSRRIDFEMCIHLFLVNVTWETEEGLEEFKDATRAYLAVDRMQFLDLYLDRDVRRKMRPYWHRYKAEKPKIREGKTCKITH